jgi:hypothetical protein
VPAQVFGGDVLIEVKVERCDLNERRVEIRVSQRLLRQWYEADGLRETPITSWRQVNTGWDTIGQARFIDLPSDPAR